MPVLPTKFAPEERDLWYDRHLQAGVQVVNSTPVWFKPAPIK
jgi:hypothetical protein